MPDWRRPPASQSSDAIQKPSGVDWAAHVRPRLAGLSLSPAREVEIVDELSQHLEDRWRELVAGGTSPEAATEAALADFSERNLLAPRLAPLRQARMPAPVALGQSSESFLRGLWRDLHYAARTLRRNPSFAATTVATLALAIGTTTAIFTVVDRLLLRPLPFPDADRLVQIIRTYPGDFGTFTSVPKFMHWRREVRPIASAMAAYGTAGFNLTGSGTPQRLMGSYVSASFFDVMGVRPPLGRAFRNGEDVPGGPKLVVLSHGLWHSTLGGRRGIIGSAITLNSEPHTVVGVMPEGFRYPDVAQLWTLVQLDPASTARAHNLEVVARLLPGISVEQARAAMDTVGRAVRRSTGDLMFDNESIGVRPLREDLYGDMRQPLLILLAAVGFVLLIASVNVANLQLAQAAGRHHEIALRTALGASTWAIARQLLVEAALLSAVGALVGIALAYVSVPALVALSPVDVPYADAIRVDWRVLSTALGVSVVVGIVFGLLPAWHSARPNLDDLLRAGARRMIGGTSRWTRRVLVAAEVALALMLTVGAFLLIKSLAGLQSISPGFVVEDVLTMKMALPESKYGTGAALARFEEAVEARLESVPGVRAAALAHILPMELGSDLPFTIEGRYQPGAQTGIGSGHYRPVSRGYFDALGIPLRRGRVFGARDRRSSLPVVVINEAAAREFWPGENPIGRRITIGQPYVPDLADLSPREIVGVVADVREEGLNANAPAILYLPISQVPEAYAALGTRLLPFAAIVRGESGATLTRSAQQAVASVDPQQPISDVRLMREIVGRSLGPQRFNTFLLGGLAVLALVLAAVGLYGVIAHIVGQQTREIGLRMALGATRSRVVGLYLRQALWLVVAGIVVGLLGAVGVTRVLQTLLSGISTSDPWAFALAPALMLAVAILAALRPAVRAAGVDPIEALRYE